MTDLDRLPPDQRAVLSLVLERGKSYGEVAEMLGIPESAVRDRAHGALDALAREAPGQVISTPVSATRGESTARAGATDVGAGAAGMTGAQGRGPRTDRDARSTRSPASSRLGGVLLLSGLVVAVVVTVILVAGGGGKSSGGGSTSPTSTSTTGAGSTSTSTSASSAPKPKIDNKLTLTAVEPSLKAGGEAYVLSQGARRAFYMAAHGLPPSSGFFYAVWLYNSPSSSAPLGRSPAVGSDGRLEGGGPLPSNAREYAKIIVTRETSTHAKQPGQIVLSGDFKVS